MTKSISLPSIEPYRSLSPKSSPFTNADAAEAENVNVKLDSNIEIHSNTMESLHDKKESARDDVSILSDTISPRTPAQKESDFIDEVVQTIGSEGRFDSTAIPYRIHNRVVGWKLTTIKRRKDLLRSLIEQIITDFLKRLSPFRLLELINNSEGYESGMLHQALTHDFVDLPPNPNRMSVEQLQHCRERQSESLDRCIERLTKGHLSTVKKTAEFIREKKRKLDLKQKKSREDLLAATSSLPSSSHTSSANFNLMQTLHTFSSLPSSASSVDHNINIRSASRSPENVSGSVASSSFDFIDFGKLDLDGYDEVEKGILLSLISRPAPAAHPWKKKPFYIPTSLLPHSRIKEKPTRLGLGSELESVDHGFESTIAATSSVSRDLSEFPVPHQEGVHISRAMVETEFSPDSIVQHSVLPKNDTDKNKGKRLVDYSRHLSTAERVAYTERIVSALNRQMLKMLTFLVQQLLKDAAKIRRMSRPQQPLDPLVNLRINETGEAVPVGASLIDADFEVMKNLFAPKNRKFQHSTNTKVRPKPKPANKKSQAEDTRMQGNTFSRQNMDQIRKLRGSPEGFFEDVIGENLSPDSHKVKHNYGNASLVEIVREELDLNPSDSHNGLNSKPNSASRLKSSNLNQIKRPSSTNRPPSPIVLELGNVEEKSSPDKPSFLKRSTLNKSPSLIRPTSPKPILS